MNNPSLLTGLGALIIWIPIAVALLTVIGWLIMGDIDSLFGFTCIGVLLGMGILSAKPPTPEMPLYLAIAAYAIVLLFPSAKLLWHRQELRQIELDAMKRAYALLEFNKANLGAKLRIAQSVNRLGYARWAHFIGVAAIKGVNVQHYKDEVALVKQWGIGIRPDEAPERFGCPRCNAPLSSGDLLCDRCGGHVVFLRLRGYYGASDWQGRMLWAWLSAVVALVAIPYFRSVLAPMPALFATLASAAVVIILIARAIAGGLKSD